jgi:hypothetical protein
MKRCYFITSIDSQNVESKPMAELFWRGSAVLFRGEKRIAVKCYGTILLVVIAIVGVISAAHATAPSVAALGFDPARFGLPLYPGATVRIGSAAASRDFAGHTQHSAVLETPDPIAIVANWYAGNWSGAVLKSYPDAPVVQFAKDWGTGNVSVVISRMDGETDIRIVVPGAY